MITEIGRQPWAVRGYVTTAEAVTTTHDITSFGYFFPLSYVVLFAISVLGIKKIVRDNAKQKGAV
jgi:cytochrome d ubiquinol oxidase subunit I